MTVFMSREKDLERQLQEMESRKPQQFIGYKRNP